MPQQEFGTVNNEDLLRAFQGVQWSKMHASNNEDMNNFVDTSYDQFVAEIERRGLSVPEYEW